MKYLLGFLLAFLTYTTTTPRVYAVCPVCTVAVGTGLGISRYLGIDDSVTGIWVGGLILSSGLWLSDWIGKRGWKLPYKEVVSVGLFYLFVIPTLYWSKMIGVPGNTLWGVDKVFLGTSIGSAVFISGVLLDRYLRKLNQGKVFIYYQKVIIPVLLLSIASFFFYTITK